MTARTVSDARPHDEQQYLDLIRTVLDTGDIRPDRTGTGTISAAVRFGQYHGQVRHVHGR